MKPLPKRKLNKSTDVKNHVKVSNALDNSFCFFLFVFLFSGQQWVKCFDFELKFSLMNLI